MKSLVANKAMPKTRNEQEIAGYRDDLATIHESHDFIPVKPSIILQLHRDLYKFSGKVYGGFYKGGDNVIEEEDSDGNKRIRFTPVPAFETPDAIDEICSTLDEMLTESDADPLLIIPMFILDFLCIHPFNDGNGRMSRLLTTLLLYRCGYVVGRYISLESKIEKTKERYYEVLNVCGEGWHEGSNDPTPFVKYLLGIILAAYRDFEDRVDLCDEKLPAIELVRRAVSQKLGKFTKSEIMELVPAIGKASVENSLKQLVKDGEIQRHGKGKSTFYTRNESGRYMHHTDTES